MTLTILIGNTDNKLTQVEWAEFIQEMRGILPKEVHFSGGSCYDVPWQNACWVIELGSTKALFIKITTLRERYKQDSVAIILGETKFI